MRPIITLAWAVFGAIGLCLLFLAGIAHGAPPAGYDPDGARAKYFKSLTRQTPIKGTMACCDVSDCRGVPWKIADDHYEVFMDDRFTGWTGPAAWMVVPEDALVKDAADPEGEAVACWTPFYGLLCFNPASGV